MKTNVNTLGLAPAFMASVAKIFRFGITYELYSETDKTFTDEEEIETNTDYNRPHYVLMLTGSCCEVGLAYYQTVNISDENNSVYKPGGIVLKTQFHVGANGSVGLNVDYNRNVELSEDNFKNNYEVKLLGEARLTKKLTLGLALGASTDAAKDESTRSPSTQPDKTIDIWTDLAFTPNFTIGGALEYIRMDDLKQETAAGSIIYRVAGYGFTLNARIYL